MFRQLKQIRHFDVNRNSAKSVQGHSSRTLRLYEKKLKDGIYVKTNV